MTGSVVTFGCRLNSVESETIRAHCTAAGLEDAIVFNTCAVTGEAVRQARQAIRRARRDNPSARIVVTGCAAQTDPDLFAAMAEVDVVLGNDIKTQAATWAGLSREPCDKVRVNDIMSVRTTAGHLMEGLDGQTRAFVEVQNGCDHRCTFCIIPFGRGNSRSVPMGVVVEQIRRLVGNGYGEVVLTGVDLTSYGPDLPGRPRLGDLVQNILAHVPDLKRLRLSSIDSIEVDEALMAAIMHDARLMPCLHLSLQAGDDLILKRMKRRHLRADAIRFCADVRKARPEMVFGADLIAGFPTETDEMFENTLKLVDECALTFIHAFPYSPRKGTPAARMPQVPRAIVKERAARLRAVGQARLHAHLDRQIGRRITVLIERNKRGRAEDFTEVRVAGGRAGDIVPARVVGHDGQRLMIDRPQQVQEGLNDG